MTIRKYTFSKVLFSYSARVRLYLVYYVYQGTDLPECVKKKKALMSASIAKSSSAKFSGPCGEQMLERRIT
jgi:hypothetical protein